MTIRHIVTWKLGAPSVEQKAEDATRIREELVGLVPQLGDIIERLEVGIDLHDTPGNWDVVLVSEFADAANLQAYQVHPAHQAAAAVIRSLVTERSAIDYTLPATS
ncbi:Dabb family protein [Okibacterium fritillariae]|jgi:quinol monooxygenase YgiN|uniref:Stress responsive A/B Barrel Domain n=1 Tax=Okibacterium fritillariae TaxID=123320 RepID=A0A1T5IP79_9MICO|nr:Dabb family protein [Okibacterium fritillariae]SKC40977.1 Stress responsive A/B Barrel Domain [Okibacterium fritillariae]